MLWNTFLLKKDIGDKHVRYIMLSQNFPCNIIHLPSKRNVVADILSSYPISDALIKFGVFYKWEAEILCYNNM